MKTTFFFNKIKLKNIFRPTLVLIALIFMLYIAIKQWQVLQNSGWSFEYSLFLPSVLGVTILIFLSVYGWNLTLAALGKDITFKKSLIIWAISFPTRYIPGGIWVYATRLSLAKTEGIDIPTNILSMYLETILTVIASITVGLVALYSTVNQPVHWEITLLIWLCSFILLHPKILTPILKLVKNNQFLYISNSLNLLTLKKTSKLIFYYTVYWILCCIFFLCFVLSIHWIEVKYWLLVGSSFALCYFFGFIIFFIPSGVGIRESALYLMLSPILPHEINLLVSVGSRLWLIAGELLFLLVTFIFHKFFWKKTSG